MKCTPVPAARPKQMTMESCSLQNNTKTIAHTHTKSSKRKNPFANNRNSIRCFECHYFEIYFDFPSLSLSLRLAISTLIWSNGIAFAYLQLDCGAIIFIYLPYALDLSWAPKISLIWSSLFLSIPEYALCSQSPVCVLSHWLWKTPLSIQRHYFLSWSGILLYIYFLWLFTAWLDWWIRRWRFDPGAVWSSHMSPVWRKFR